MAVVADRVIVELEAKLDRYEANVRRAEAKFDSATRAISADAKRMARDIESNSAAAGSSIRALATTFAAGFSAARVAQLADGYTRFTNQLKVAGLEGKELAKVQGQLFNVAQSGGTPLELLGRLYGGLASLQRDLNTTSADSIALSQAVANSIKVQGTSSEQAAGAILGLNQALAQTRVQSDEYNQILDGARPLLQAAVNASDRYAGSLARLKQDIEAGKVSGRDLFAVLQAGFPLLAAQAEKAQMTISQSFTVLNNALGQYIGQTDQAYSATEQISQAIILLSQNLDTVATALGLIGSVLLGRFAAGMVGAATSTGVASAAMFALQARAVGAATTMEAVGFAGAAAGRSLLAAFGGPVGIAVAALSVGLFYLSDATGEEAQQAALAADEINRMRQQADAGGAAASTLASASGTAAGQMQTAAAKARALAEELYGVRAAALLAAQALAQEKLQLATKNAVAAATRDDRTGFGKFSGVGREQSRAEKAENKRNFEEVYRAGYDVALTQRALEDAKRETAAAKAPPPLDGKKTKAKKPKKGREGAKGPDPAELARRFEDDLARGMQELAQATADRVGTAEAALEAERARIETDRKITERGIKADKDLTAARREQLLTLNDQIAAEKKAALDAAEKQRVADEALTLAAGDLSNQQEILNAQSQLADTSAARRDIALRILDLQEQEERLRLEALVASRTATEAEKGLARRRLAALDTVYDAQRAGAERQNESPLQAYARRVSRTPEQMREQAETLVVTELEHVQDGITGALSKALGTKDPLITGLIEMFVQQVIMRPIADAFAQMGGGGGGGGFLGSVFGSLFGGVDTGGATLPGRASGGHVMAGKMYRVNEGGGIEGFQPSGSGKIIPLGRMRSSGGGGVVIHQTVNVDSRGSVNPDGFADHIRESVRGETVKIVGVAMKQVTKSAPGRLAQYQRDGV